MKRALVTFDKFKDALTACDACEIVCSALRAKFHDCVVNSAPLSDGGEGFCEILTTAARGSFERIEVRGPLGESTTARLGFVQADNLPPSVTETANLPTQGRIAVIEMAAAAGLHLLPEDDRNPWETSTHGVGDMIMHAVEHGSTAILMGIGGSATNDLGLGALQGLGLRFKDANDNPIERIRPSAWHRLVCITGSLMNLPPLRIACDVQNPLAGPSGATAVYGLQKGFKTKDLARAESGLVQVASLLMKANATESSLMDEPSSGSAGGLGFGLRVATNATFVSGFTLVSKWLGLENLISETDLVITGEGRFDFSSLQGKGPCSLAKMAASKGKPVLILAGSVDLKAVEELKAICPRTSVLAISRPELSLEENLRETPKRLSKVLQAWIETEQWELL